MTVPYHEIRTRPTSRYQRLRILLERYCQQAGESPDRLWNETCEILIHSRGRYQSSESDLAAAAADVILSLLSEKQNLT